MTYFYIILRFIGTYYWNLLLEPTSTQYPSVRVKHEHDKIRATTKGSHMDLRVKPPLDKKDSWNKSYTTNLNKIYL